VNILEVCNLQFIGRQLVNKEYNVVLFDQNYFIAIYTIYACAAQISANQVTRVDNSNNIT